MIRTITLNCVILKNTQTEPQKYFLTKQIIFRVSQIKKYKNYFLLPSGKLK